MRQPPENKDLEDRFMEEVVVDAYREEERARGWYYYAADNIVFPFKAGCSAKRTTAPLKIGEAVEVTDSMAREEARSSSRSIGNLDAVR